MDSTHGQTTSEVACHHRLWEAFTDQQRRAWIKITALGLHAQLEDVGRGMTSPPFDSTDCLQRRVWTSKVALHHRPWTAYSVGNVERGMKSRPLDSTHGRTSSGMAFHHHLWEAHTVKRRWAWHDITAFGQHTRLNDVRRGIPSSPIGSKHARQRRAWHDNTALR